MSPASGTSKPAIMRSVVVLPHPDGPSSEMNSPGWIVSDTRSSVTGGRRDAILVWALFLLAWACFPLAALVIDSGRDFASGLAIMQGDGYPAYGPSLNGLWQPGPVWFYLLAAMLATSGSVGGTALLVGALRRQEDRHSIGDLQLVYGLCLQVTPPRCTHVSALAQRPEDAGPRA